MTETFFVAASSTVDMAKAVGIPTGDAPGIRVDPCPFAVGDFISFAASPSVTFRVAWRAFSYPSASRPACWAVGVEQADHPLESLV